MDTLGWEANVTAAVFETSVLGEMCIVVMQTSRIKLMNMTGLQMTSASIAPSFLEDLIGSISDQTL